MNRDLPCCQEETLLEGQVRPVDAICFIFGDGICQPIDSIRKLTGYSQMIRNINSTNFPRLYYRYWSNLGVNKTNEVIDTHIYALQQLEHVGRIVYSGKKNALNLANRNKYVLILSKKKL